MEKGRQDILQGVANALRGVEPGGYNLSRLHPIRYKDPLSQFITMVQLVGGEVLKGSDSELDTWLGETFSGKEILKILEGNYDDFENQPTDVVVIRSDMMVAENGAVWIEMKSSGGTAHRSLLFLAETIVVVVDPKNLVHTMDEAYSLLKNRSFDYGTFISGPSKTADIEQALVIGAQGPARAVVWLALR